MSDLAKGAKTKISISFTCFDGLGRDVQTKTIAECDLATPLTPRWVGSAWKVLNNKGDAVRVFRIYGQAGTETNTEFDFKNHLVTRMRQLAVEHSLTLDWTDIVSIAPEPDIHPETTYTNAIGQTIDSRSADGCALRYTYNAAGLPETIDQRPGREEA
ncbi:hypothetical protein F4802DRAFT_576222 [Xylaria palmicola]|nr:hypothetical protein F4802DRAFT_576222 [Xylaria palmicola]